MPRKNHSPRRARRGHQELDAKRLLSELKDTRKEKKRDGKRNR
jgi:hypothetical protein